MCQKVASFSPRFYVSESSAPSYRLQLDFKDPGPQRESRYDVAFPDSVVRSDEYKFILRIFSLTYDFCIELLRNMGVHLKSCFPVWDISREGMRSMSGSYSAQEQNIEQ